MLYAILESKHSDVESVLETPPLDLNDLKYFIWGVYKGIQRNCYKQSFNLPVWPEKNEGRKDVFVEFYSQGSSVAPEPLTYYIMASDIHPPVVQGVAEQVNLNAGGQDNYLYFS